MTKSAPNPVEHTYSRPSSSSASSTTSNDDTTANAIPHPEPISSKTYYIAGIKTTVFGLEELSNSTTDVAVLWLLHPRLQTQACMAPFAAHLIYSWNNKSTTKSKGLIAVSFDQRNHGTREISPIANEAWRNGNELHAQDMFSVYHGTALDTSLLLDYLAAYIFPEPDSKIKKKIVQNIVLGISLGGHAAWHCIMQDNRISAAVVTIGCPDYTRLMSDRARLSKRKTWTETQGRNFIGSIDFPDGLVEAVKKYDPAGILWGGLERRRRGQEHLYEDLSGDERAKLMPLMAKCLGNKRILNLSGGSDKLVPYTMGEPFLNWVKKAIGKGGWFEGGGLHLEDIVVPDCGHEVPPAMVKEMVRFVNDTLEAEQEMGVGKRGLKESRI